MRTEVNVAFPGFEPANPVALPLEPHSPVHVTLLGLLDLHRGLLRVEVDVLDGYPGPVVGAEEPDVHVLL